MTRGRLIYHSAPFGTLDGSLDGRIESRCRMRRPSTLVCYDPSVCRCNLLSEREMHSPSVEFRLPARNRRGGNVNLLARPRHTSQAPRPPTGCGSPTRVEPWCIRVLGRAYWVRLELSGVRPVPACCAFLVRARASLYARVRRHSSLQRGDSITGAPLARVIGTSAPSAAREEETGGPWKRHERVTDSQVIVREAGEYLSLILQIAWKLRGVFELLRGIFSALVVVFGVLPCDWPRSDPVE